METSINQRIKLLRTALNLTQTEFANRIGNTLTTISRIENGTNEPRQSTILTIAKEFNVNKEWLFEGIGELNTTDLKHEQKYSAQIVVNPWQDALVSELKSEVEFLRKLLLNVTGREVANFNDAFDLATFFKKESIESVRVAA